ncbi:hypothetical protein [Sporomusa sp. KB1]|jgi:hypothetical protein|uniref:hypothetical protein n=1 Tax=Sporomusa sp. KB1 TaxID=943346 RepID=UPI0011AB041C|nr:hypothetical protein [Sporomusa sp. KB1]TWH46184.1 hypothetical protein Salpa_2138 [Sporomusa sp. KB1]
MSTVSSISAYTTSTLLSATTSSSDTTIDATTNAVTTTDTSSSDTADTAAYSLEITPALIKAALQNTYTSQLLASYQDATISNLVLYDCYNNLSSNALNYVVSSNADSSTTSSSTSTLDFLV